MTAVQEKEAVEEDKVPEQDILDPVPGTYVLKSGIEVAIEPLKTRQFMRLFRIITHGAPVYLEGGISSLFEGDTEEFVSRLLAMIMFSVPEAEDQTIEFLTSMVSPTGLIVSKNLNKTDRERNAVKWTELEIAMTNPDLEDTVGIVELIIRREAKDLAALGKRLMSMLEVTMKTGAASPSASTPI